MGGQVCNAAGSGFGVCECATPDAGPFDAGPVDGGPEDMSRDADVVDMNADDLGPPGPCSPLTHAGCAATERCTWVRIDSTLALGSMQCVPDGTVAVGGACTTGPDGETTGYDDCARGLHCIDAVCTRVCNLVDPTSCGADVCMRYSGVFASGSGDPVAGVCTTGCDPVTQLRTDGSSCGAGQGCYVRLGRGDAACAPVPSPAASLVHGDAAYGPAGGGAYINGCAPGFIPGLAVGGQAVCMALCRPIETSSSAPAGAAGEAPHSCPDRGAASPGNECIFTSVFADSSAPYDPRVNDIGVCVDLVAWTFDLDGDAATPPTPWPDCTMLANTDTNGDGVAEHLFSGCAPAPAP